MGPPIEVREILARKVSGTWRGYQEPMGHSGLRKLLGDRLSSVLNIEITTSQVAITTGATSALFAAYVVLGKQGVLVPNPGFPLYYEALKHLNIECIPYPVGIGVDWGETLENIERALMRGVRLVVWNFPSNPLGLIPPDDVVHEFSKLFHKYDAWCICDEVYRDFTFERDVISPYSLVPEKSIFVYSFSKAYGMAGMRVGAVVGPEKIVAKIASIQWSYNMSVSWIAQEAGIAALNTDYPNTLRHQLSANRNMAFSILHNAGIPYLNPDGGIFVCLNTEQLPMHSTEFTRLCWHQVKVLATPCEKFGGRGINIVRINIAAENQQIVDGINRVADLYQNL